MQNYSPIKRVNRAAIILAFFVLSSFSFAQQWTAATMLNPFPSPYISEWQSNPAALGSVIVTNNTNQPEQIRVRISVALSGKGIVAKTTATGIFVPPMTTKTLYSMDILKYEDIEFPISDLKNKVIQSGRLPEGNYTACFTVENMAGTPLTQTACGNFTITYPAQPQLVFPFDNGEILSFVSHIFQWTPVVVPPTYQIKYSIKFVEILQGQTPYQAITANIPIHESSNILTNNYVYPNSAVKFENNKKYAWQVQVLDQYGMPPTQNQGKSEIFTFKLKKEETPQGNNLPVITYPLNRGKIRGTNNGITWTYQERQGEETRFQINLVKMNKNQTPLLALRNNPKLLGGFIPRNIRTQGLGGNLKFNTVDKYALSVSVVDLNTGAILNTSEPVEFTYEPDATINLLNMSTVTGPLMYRFAGPGEGQLRSLANANVKLVLKYVLKVKSSYGDDHQQHPIGSWVDVGPAFASTYNYKDNNKVIATGTTDEAGYYRFTFYNNYKSGQIVKTNAEVGITTGEFRKYWTGDVYQFFRVEVDGVYFDYFTNPEENIKVDPGQTENVFISNSIARTYDLKIKILPDPNVQEQATHMPLDNTIVYLLRKVRPLGVPITEGFPEPTVYPMKDGMEIVAMDTTSSNPQQLGTVTFKHVFKNVGPTDEYYIYAETNKEKGSYNYHTPHAVKYVYYLTSDNAFYSSEYYHITKPQDIIVSPMAPRIWGRVKRSDVGMPLSGAKVTLSNYSMFSSIIEAERTTSYNGYFTPFGGLPVKFQNGIATGPLRFLTITQPGFETKTMIVQGTGQNSAMRYGEQWNNFEIALKPSSVVTGSVVNESNLGVKSYVQIGEGRVEVTSTPIYNPQTKHFTPAKFSTQAIIGNQQRLVIEPISSKYFPETTYVNITALSQSLGSIIVKQKLHRIRIYVKEKKNGLVTTWPNVNEAMVMLKVNNSTTLSKTPVNSNFVEFEFENDGENFEVTVLPPQGKYYTPVYTTITNAISKATKSYYIGMKKAGFVSGKVLVLNKKPVVNARVYIDLGDNHLLQTKTNNKGEYLLANVPINVPVTIWVTKASDDTTFIGNKIEKTVPETGLTNVDFNLTVYDGMDITNLLGFPIEVKSLEEKGMKRLLISGNIINIPGNQSFKMDAGNPVISFDTLLVKPGTKKNTHNIPICVPVNKTIYTNSNSLNIKVFDKFAGKIKDHNIGLYISEGNQGYGTINGMVNIGPEQFNSSGIITGFTGLFLAPPTGSITQQSLRLPVFTPDSTKPTDIPNGYRVASMQGNDLTFKVSGFEATAGKDSSWFTGDTLKLNTTIKAQIPKLSIPNDKIAIGNIRLHSSAIEPLNFNRELIIGMDQWSIKATKWSMANFLSISEGSIRTGVVDVPIKSLVLKPTELTYASFEINKMNIAGIPMTITGTPVLNYDITKSAWVLYVSKDNNPSCAYFSNLPGMEPNGKVFIESFSFTSKGEKTFAPQVGQQPVKILSLWKLQPGTVEEFDNTLQFNGLSFDPAIPQCSQSSFLRYYVDENKQTKYRVVPFNLAFEVNGVICNFGGTTEQQESQVFSNASFKSYGTVKNPGKFEFKGWLYHTPQETKFVLENPNLPDRKSNQWQTLKIGTAKTYFNKIEGGSIVENGAWKNFEFAGDLEGTPGISDQQNKRMNFVSDGDVKAVGQTLSVKRVPFAFGDMSWVYDFDHNRLTGTVQIEGDLGGMSVSNGFAQTLIDGEGWYFGAGATVNVNGIGPITAAILFGDYPALPNDIVQMFKNVSYENRLPKSFKNSISGFMFTGAIEVPVLIPSINLDLIIASAKFGLTAGGALSVYADFQGNGNTYEMSLAQFIHAYLSMSSITCTQLSADAKLELLFTGIYNTGPKTYSISGCGGFTLDASIKQKFWGCDFDGCGCKYTIFSEGFSFGFHADASINSSGNFKVSFGRGGCE